MTTYLFHDLPVLSTKSILCDTAVVIKSQSLSVYMSCRIFTEKLAVAKNNIFVGDLYYDLCMNMSSEVRKTVSGVYNQARQKNSLYSHRRWTFSI